MHQVNIFDIIEQEKEYQITLNDLYEFLTSNFPQCVWKEDDAFKGFTYTTNKREVNAHILNMYDGSIKLGCGFQNKGGSWHGCSGTVNNYEELKNDLEKYLGDDFI